MIPNIPTQAYTELPQNVFNPLVNPSDWLEIIDSGQSQSSSRFSNDSQEATVVGYIPWNKQRSAAEWFLGYASVKSNGMLSRNNPEQHGIFPQLFASEISFKPFNPTVNPDNPSAPLQFVSPWFGNTFVSINTAYHKLAVTAVTYRSVRYTFLDDSAITDMRQEFYRNVYLDLDPSIQTLSADGISQLAFVETSARIAGPPTIPAGPAVNTPFPAPLAVLLGKNKFTLNWLNVPLSYLSTATNFFYPTNLIAGLGCVNSQPFPYGGLTQFPIGTLLMHGVKFEQKVVPIAPADPSFPLIWVNVAIELEYFNPPTGAPSPITQGHNLMPWRSNGLFYYATRVDPQTNSATTSTPPLLNYYDFNYFFVNPNS